MPISGAELTIAARAVATLRRLLRRPDPLAVIKRREQVREELRTNLRWPEKEHEAPEIMVVRVGKEDHRGKPDRRLLSLGASHWLKFEVKGVHERGFEVFDSIQYVTIGKGKARRVPVGETRADQRKIWVVERIAYERIGHIDWQPDPYYGGPRLYVAYGRRGPFKEVALYEGSPSDYLYEIQDVKYKGDGAGAIKRVRRRVQHAHLGIEVRRQKRQMRDAG